MTIAPLFHTPDEWVAVLKETCDGFTQALDDAVADATRKIEQADPGLLAGLGFVVGPLPGVAWALGADDHAKDELRARLASANRDAAGALRRLSATVFREADGVMGDPVRLVAASRRHLTAKAELDEVCFRAHLGRTQVDRYWRGGAERAFYSATGFQVAAVASYGEWLATAAGLLAGAAEAIKTMWSDLLHALLDLGTGLLRDIASAFDVGNVLAFEVGPILASVATAIDAVEAIGQVVRVAAARAETTMTLQWQTMASSAAVPGGRWPRIDDLDLADLSDAGRWRL